MPTCYLNTEVLHGRQARISVRGGAVSGKTSFGLYKKIAQAEELVHNDLLKKHNEKGDT
ncbi:MAG: hypothetical protein KAS17_09220 [Victivallaceae bacterium]|nr:hypothetical protein [Victivallaceae bacterium]